MRVLLANKFFRPGAGAETAFFATRKLLQDHGHDVVDFAMAAPDNVHSEYARYFAPHRSYASSASIPSRARDAVASVYSPAARRSIRALIDATRPDVAHLHNVYHQLTLSIVDELQCQRVPVVMTLHDYKVVCPSHTLFTEGATCRRCVKGHPFSAVRHRCIKQSAAASTLGAVETALARVRRTYQNIDLVAPSHFLAGLAAHQADPDNIHVVPNFLPDRAPAAAPDWDRRRRAILFAGRLELVKGIEPLVRAFTDHDTSGVELVVAGDGPLRPLVARAASSHPAVSYLGRVDADEVDRLLRSTLGLAVPSLWEENCPMSILEARRAGTPVLTASSGGLPELVTPGMDGILLGSVSPEAIAEAVRTLCAEPDTWRRMAQSGRERFLSRHSAGVHLAALETAYATAIARQAPGGHAGST